MDLSGTFRENEAAAAEDPRPVGDKGNLLKKAEQRKSLSRFWKRDSSSTTFFLDALEMMSLMNSVGVGRLLMSSIINLCISLNKE